MSLDVNVTPGVNCGFASPMPPRPQNHQFLLKTLWHPNPGAMKQKWVPQEHPMRKLGNKVECSCLTALENLKIKEHNAFVKFAEHMRKHPPKVKEKEAPVVYKRYSLQK
ncbi:hypothetical protein V9T40_010549 [Parthenolecanium corni]|uniref:Uncharacterized protein n=1 Tax=Parthenolecanium corni TaxID=536013 RepID=A0AAN9XYJ9_9HEMI